MSNLRLEPGEAEKRNSGDGKKWRLGQVLTDRLLTQQASRSLVGGPWQ
jgi:hypothetical protein